MSDVALIVDAMWVIQRYMVGSKEKVLTMEELIMVLALPEAGDNLATEALVFILGGVTGHWKHPIGYFLQNKISASVQA